MSADPPGSGLMQGHTSSVDFFLILQSACNLKIKIGTEKQIIENRIQKRENVDTDINWLWNDIFNIMLYIAFLKKKMTLSFLIKVCMCLLLDSDFGDQGDINSE